MKKISLTAFSVLTEERQWPHDVHPRSLHGVHDDVAVKWKVAIWPFPNLVRVICFLMFYETPLAHKKRTAMNRKHVGLMVNDEL